MAAKQSSEGLDDQVIEFYDTLFGRIFSAPFRAQIADRLKQKAVLRRVEESADAASQALIRLFQNERLSARVAADILGGFAPLADHIALEDIANPNVTPEELVEAVIAQLPCPESLRGKGQDAVYRVALHTVLQVLMLVGPVMAEWQRLTFASTFELMQRVVNRLNKISARLDALGQAGQEAEDDRFELSYRDYLLQRFFRVEAGTVRMATNLSVDLGELFVMPRVRPRRGSAGDGEAAAQAGDLMDLAAAREAFDARRQDPAGREAEAADDEAGTPAIDYLKWSARCVLVGLPGAGKSTFLEWFQLQLAAVEEELVLGEAQAIPLLLRVRQLDLERLPTGAALIAAATASQDRATLMPAGWIDRQMEAGRMVFMLDGLDECDPGLSERHILPWLEGLITRYPRCHYLISSRPVGYPPGRLRRLEFEECDLLDFDPAQIRDYARHWCTAVRLARNEPAEEARREGAADGDGIVAGFQDQRYIHDLARNPLMLSAICLVNYFEGGELPKDRALLYQLCVEGLLHNWDQRRGIHSDFTLEEKLRVCREVALTMQADDRAEYPAERIQEIMAAVLGEDDRAQALLEHVRYRTGLLLERRPQVFAFAHLTFQEYLAARAVHEGNKLDIDPPRLVREHDDGRWWEVIALYCGLAPAPMVREVIWGLIDSADTLALSQVLAETYLSSGPEIVQDLDFRAKLLWRIARAPKGPIMHQALFRFPPQEVAPIANASLGKIQSSLRISEAHSWLSEYSEYLDEKCVMERLASSPNLNGIQMSELVHILFYRGSDAAIIETANNSDLLSVPGPEFRSGSNYGVQGDIALIGLSGWSREKKRTEAFALALLQALRSIDKAKSRPTNLGYSHCLSRLFNDKGFAPVRTKDWPEFVELARRLERRLMDVEGFHEACEALQAFAERLESLITEGSRAEGKALSAAKKKPAKTRAKKTKPKRRTAP